MKKGACYKNVERICISRNSLKATLYGWDLESQTLKFFLVKYLNTKKNR